MGGPKEPKVPKTPLLPEIKKRTEADARQNRENIKREAISRYGLAGTNVTKGMLADSESTTKKSKLGG